MLEILIDNRNGNVWDISEIVSEAKWKTSRVGKPGEFEFTLIKNGGNIKDFKYENGNIVRVRYKHNGTWHNIFYGYVFEIEEGKNEDAKIKCYDQTRYLMFKDTYVFKNVTATDVVRRIANDFGLVTGKLANTGYRIPSMVEDNKKLMDIICKALDHTLINTNIIYNFFDDFGKLTLKDARDMLVLISIGDGSLLYDYTYKRSIDSDTYNRVKLVQDNKKTGKRDVYIAQDSKNIAKWGVLQLYEKVEENKNAAQIKELLNQLIKLKNREEKSLKLPAIGDPRIRAGCYIPVTISDLKINQAFIVNECTHKFDGADHTMELEVKVI